MEVSMPESSGIGKTCDTSMGCATVFEAIFLTWFHGPYWPVNSQYVCEDAAGNSVNIQLREPEPSSTRGGESTMAERDPARVRLVATTHTSVDIVERTTLIDRYLSHRTHAVTSDPWIAFDHFMSGYCRLDLRLTLSPRESAPISVSDFAEILVLEAVLPAPPLMVDLAITRHLHVADEFGLDLEGTTSAHLYLPTSLGEELRRHYISQGGGFVPASSYELAGALMPEVAHGLIPVFDMVPALSAASTPTEFETETFTSVRHANFFLIRARPLASVRILLSQGLERILDELRALHARLLTRSVYRRLWFRHIRDRLRPRLPVHGHSSRRLNRWLPPTAIKAGFPSSIITQHAVHGTQK